MKNASDAMAEHPPIQFEDIPLDEARRMGRGPRMDPQLYRELTTRIRARSDTAMRIAIPDGTRLATMKRPIRSVAAELKIPVTIRRVPDGLLCWRSTDEDVTQAREVGAQLQNARRRHRLAQRASAEGNP